MTSAYGVTINGIHTDVSKTQQGAKNYATRNGFTIVSVRFGCGCIVDILAEKVDGVWISQV